MKTMSLCVTEFLNSSGVQDLAPSTRKRQRIVLSRLIKQFPLNQPIARLESWHIDAALNECRKTVSVASLNAYKSDLRRFCKFLHTRGLVKSDKAAHLTNAKAKTVASKRKPLAASQINEVLAAAEARHPRDGMTALLMLCTGMRESEVIGLRWQDVDLDAGYVKAFRPKIDDWHTALFNDELEEAFPKWKAFYEERHGALDPEWFVVPALAHRSESPGHWLMHPDWPMVPTKRQNSVGVRVKSWMEQAGEEDLRGRASHTLRRTAGNLLIDVAGADIREVQTFYGHSSVAMTELYLDKDAAQDKLRRRLKGFRVRQEG